MASWGTCWVGLTLLAGCGAGVDGVDAEQVGELDQSIIDGQALTDAGARNSGVVMLESGCSGTLLDVRWVLTAAHCFKADVDANHDREADQPELTRVRFGNVNDASAVVIPAGKVLLHPSGFWDSPADVDVALIYLSQPAPTVNVLPNHFSNGKMLLYPGKDASLQGKLHTLIGYGKNVRGYGSPYTGSGTLRFGTRNVSSTSPTKLNFTPGDSTYSPNNGDSGGPAFYDQYDGGTLAARWVTGVTSTTTSYTGAEAFREWVSKTVWGKLKPTIIAHSGFALPTDLNTPNPKNLLDGDITSAAVDKDTTAWVELDLGGQYQLTHVKMGEDNYQDWKVGSYSLQCWNGSSWNGALFDDNQTDAALPRFDEHPIANGCTTNRVRVNFANPQGSVEVFELELYGTAIGSRTVTVAATPGQCTTSPAPGVYSVPVGSNFSVCGEDCGSFHVKQWSVTGDVRTGDTNTTCLDLRDVRANASVSAEFKQYVGVSATSNGHGLVGHDWIMDGSGFLAEVGTTVSFTMQPDTMYRVKEVCSPRFPSCLPWNQTSYNVTNIGLNDFWFKASFELENAAVKRSGKCLDARDAANTNGTQIQQYACNGNKAQWFYSYPLDVSYTDYVISHPDGSKCLDVAGASKANGAKVQLWDCTNSAAQKWRFEDMGGGYYRIRNPNANKCLDVAGSSTADRAVVQLWDCGTADNQRWRFPHPTL